MAFSTVFSFIYHVVCPYFKVYQNIRLVFAPPGVKKAPDLTGRGRRAYNEGSNSMVTSPLSPGRGGDEGIRWEPGAIPVAVCMGGRRSWREPVIGSDPEKAERRPRGHGPKLCEPEDLSCSQGFGSARPGARRGKVGRGRPFVVCRGLFHRARPANSPITGP